MSLSKLFGWGSPDLFSLDTPLTQFEGIDWTIRHSVEGTIILGGTGSGKTTGSGSSIALALLRAGYSGLVLTVKSSETQHWIDLCNQTQRQDDLCLFGPAHPATFNFLNYAHESGGGIGLTENLVGLFSTILEVADRGRGGARDEEGYWRRANRQLTRNAIDLLCLAHGKVTVPELYKIVVSAPLSIAQLQDTNWQNNSLCFQLLSQASKSPVVSSNDFEIVSDYYISEFPGLSDKTRSVIVSTFTSMIDVLNRGALRKLFCTTTTITPKDIELGRIVVLDIPVKEYAEVGQFAQVLWKHVFQRYIERRHGQSNLRPVFLWIDEAQHFLTSYDALFASTCRSAGVAFVLLTQNIGNLHSAFGGWAKGKSDTDSLIGNLNTKIFHANSDPDTNNWAASLIGKIRQFRVNAGVSQKQLNWLGGTSDQSQHPQLSSGISEFIDFEVQPNEFTHLRTGGPENSGIVDGILFSTRLYRSLGRTWSKIEFRQS